MNQMTSNVKEIAHTEETTKNSPDYVHLASFSFLFWFYDSQVLVCFILTTLISCFQMIKPLYALYKVGSCMLQNSKIVILEHLKHLWLLRSQILPSRGGGDQNRVNFGRDKTLTWNSFLDFPNVFRTTEPNVIVKRVILHVSMVKQSLQPQRNLANIDI